MDASIARSRLSRADRMEQTLNAAHALFAERGYAAVKMDEIAASVGVTKPLLYNYFGNKERLYIACMRAFFAFLDSDRAAWAVLFDETLPRGGEVAERVADYRRRIVELVSGSMLAQLPEARRNAARVEIEALSVALLGAAEALARWWLRTEQISADGAAELLISTIEPGLRARSAPTTSQPRQGGTTTR